MRERYATSNAEIKNNFQARVQQAEPNYLMGLDALGIQ
jgi:hypothetical protein